MTVTFNFYEYEIFFVLLNIIWIIQGSSLVAGCHVLKRDSNELRFLNILSIAGYMLTGWYIITFFLPTSIMFSSPSDEVLFFTIGLVLYSIMPMTVLIILGITFLIFFYKNNHVYKKSLVYILILFVGVKVLSLVHNISMMYFAVFDFNMYFDLADYFLAIEIISLCIQISVILVITLYSIYINNRFFMIFSSLFLVQLFYNLIPTLPSI